MDIQTLVCRPFNSVPVFSEDQIRFLAPLLAEGLRAAAPDQCVEYRVVTTHKGSKSYNPDHGNHRRFPLRLWPTAVRDTFSIPLQPDAGEHEDVKTTFGREAQSIIQASGTVSCCSLHKPPNGPIALNRRQGIKSTERFLAIDYQLLQQWVAMLARRLRHVGQICAGGIEERHIRIRISYPQRPWLSEVEALKKEIQSA